MSDFTVHTSESAPQAAKDTLHSVEKSLGMVPNLAWVMAEAPALLKGYFTLNDIFEQSSFSPGECQVVSLCVSAWNRCHYCVPAHSVLAKAAKVPPQVVAAIREGQPIPDTRLETLRRFINAMLEKQGRPDEGDLQAFYDAGYSKANVLEVILGIGLNTLSNYTNHIANTPLDKAYADEV